MNQGSQSIARKKPKIWDSIKSFNKRMPRLLAVDSFMWAVLRNHWPCPRIKTAFISRGIDGFTFGVGIDPGQTGLLVSKGDLVYFYGTGEVTTCPHSNCNQRGPQQLNQGTISYQIGNNQPQTLSRFTKIHFNGGGLQNSGLASTSGFFTLTIRDGDLSTASYKNYEDNSSVYILDIFVIDPKQEEGFNRFKDSLFRANSADSNVKAYLGW